MISARSFDTSQAFSWPSTATLASAAMTFKGRSAHPLWYIVYERRVDGCVLPLPTEIEYTSEDQVYDC